MRSRDELLMSVARQFALQATCSRLHVGAVASKEGRILSTGYNGAPAGMPHCAHHFEDKSCIESVHAEANAIAFAARHGVTLSGATLHTTHSPCMTCAHLLVNSGFVRVVYQVAYRDTSPLAMLARAGVEVVKL